HTRFSRDWSSDVCSSDLAIPEVTSTGVDMDVLWQTGITGLMLQGGLTYAETEYGNDPLPDADLALLPGNQMSFAPKWSGNASVRSEERRVGKEWGCREER